MNKMGWNEWVKHKHHWMKHYKIVRDCGYSNAVAASYATAQVNKDFNELSIKELNDSKRCTDLEVISFDDILDFHEREVKV